MRQQALEILGPTLGLGILVNWVLDEPKKIKEKEVKGRGTAVSPGTKRNEREGFLP